MHGGAHLAQSPNGCELSSISKENLTASSIDPSTASAIVPQERLPHQRTKYTDNLHRSAGTQAEPPTTSLGHHKNIQGHGHGHKNSLKIKELRGTS